MQEFIRYCSPTQYPGSQDQGLTFRGGGGADPGFVSADYEKRYAELRVYFQDCLAKAPTIGSNVALRQIMDDFQQLFLKYNPKSHYFTRAINAFQRGNNTAYVAAGIAMTIDLLILACGVAVRRFDDEEGLTSHDDLEEAPSELTREQMAVDLLWREPELIAHLAKTAEREMRLVDGREVEMFVCGLSDPVLNANRPYLRELSEIGMIEFRDDTISLNREEYLKVMRFLFENKLA